MAIQMRLCLIPLDSRPVCYDFPRRLALSAGVELCLPAPTLLSQLKKPGNFKGLQRWYKTHLVENDPVVAALDTIAYGGLIPSRAGDESLEILQDRIQRFFSTVQATSLYGFSSILRIPNYDNSEEEPPYWAQYGKKLYAYSAQIHEFGKANPVLRKSIPETVLDDFLSRRNRNMAINLSYLERLKSGKLGYLAFCQDDTGPWGLNVLEAQQLQSEIDNYQLSQRAHVQTGADEVAVCMLARWLSEQYTEAEPVRIYPFYGMESGKSLMARFDGIPISQVVSLQIQACGAVIAQTPEDSDLWLLVHTPERRQGDHCEKNEDADLQADQTARSAETILNKIQEGFSKGKPVAIADVAYANGADPSLVEPLLANHKDLTKLYGYAGWNTPGNTIGSALAMGITRWIAEKHHTFQPAVFHELLLIRFGDDWFYQSHVRRRIRAANRQNGIPSVQTLNVEMSDGLNLLKKRLNLEDTAVTCRFPCQRTFEVEIGLQHASS